MTDLVCLPAIDIRDGKCVRLIQGDFAQETIFGDPVEQAKRYVADGADWLHVVDLDAARTGTSQNRPMIAEIISSSGIDVQVGGGIRDDASASFYLDAGARRVIVGTAGVEDPQLLAELVDRHPGQIGLGLDHRQVDGSSQRQVAVRGWERLSGRTLDEVVGSVEALGLDALVVTDIGRDGMLSGPDLSGYAELLATTALPLVASGGIKVPQDLHDLAALSVGGRVLEGAITGRALLGGEMTLEEAMAACVR